MKDDHTFMPRAHQLSGTNYREQPESPCTSDLQFPMHEIHGALATVLLWCCCCVGLPVQRCAGTNCSAQMFVRAVCHGCSEAQPSQRCAASGCSHPQWVREDYKAPADLCLGPQAPWARDCIGMALNKSKLATGTGRPGTARSTGARGLGQDGDSMASFDVGGSRPPVKYAWTVGGDKVSVHWRARQPNSREVNTGCCCHAGEP